MPTQAEIFLAVTKSSLESLTNGARELIHMVSEMGLLDIEADLRGIFEKLLVLTKEVDNYDEDYLVKRQTMYQLSKALEKEAYQEYHEFWDGRPERLPYVPKPGEVTLPTKGEEDLL